MGITPDIRQYKNELRQQYRTLRKGMTPEEKRQKDQAIFEQITVSSYYKQADTLLCFVSTPLEIDTHRLIDFALSQGKRVAVPKCLDQAGTMAFFVIRSFDDMEKSTFSLWEPRAEKCEALLDVRASICIVPGFSFDPEGYRLGYGKGYYDRFLSKYSEIKIGICYNNCVAPKLPHGRFDVPVDYLFTEKYVKKIKK